MANERTAGPLASVAAVERSNPFATGLVVIYIFSVMRPVLVTSLLGLAVAFLTGGLIRELKSWPAVLLILFTGWIMLATLTSAWPGGSARMLKDLWAGSLAAFLVIAGLVVTFQQLRKTVAAVAVAVVVAALLTKGLGQIVADRFSLAVGTFGNANELAFILLFGAPLCIYCMMEAGIVRGVLWIGGLGPLVYTVILTASRGGLVILAVLLLMMLLKFSWMNRLKVVIAGLIIAGALAVAPRALQERYQTILMSNEDVDNPVAASAMESRESRIVLLRESLAITMQHPLFGGGPGLFPVVQDNYARSQGERGMWRQTHNAYTQISSECGIPALVLFLAALIWNWRTLGRVGRGARESGNLKIGNLAFCLSMSLVAFSVCCLFDSIAYQYYLPVLLALTLSLEQSTKQMLTRGAVVPSAVGAASLPGAPWAMAPRKNFPERPNSLGRPGVAPAPRARARRGA